TATGWSSRGRCCSTSGRRGGVGTRGFWSDSAMFRYVAFVWNDQDPGVHESAHELLQRQSAAGGDWRVALSGGGMEVRYAGAGDGSCSAYTLTEGGGVVLGNLFERKQEGVSTAASSALGEG